MDEASFRTDAAIYRLLRVPGLDAAALARVLTCWRKQPGEAVQFWSRTAEEYRRQWSLTPRSARYLAEADEEDEGTAAGAALLTAAAAEIELVSLLDPCFAVLAESRDLPPVLFTRGNQDHLWRGGVAIPHSRDAADEALAWGALLATAVAKAGVGLVTGHNREGYRRVAAAGKRGEAPLTVVLDRPLHGSVAHGPGAEPVSTARLWDDRFRPERELVVSALPPLARWVPAHSQSRDRLVIHLAEVIVAGEVRSGGNIAGLCARAAAAGRRVFRSPFCRAELRVPYLPERVEAAAELILREVDQQRLDGPDTSPQPAPPEPGWVERRCAAETQAFVASLASLLGQSGWSERRPMSSLQETSGARGANEVAAPLMGIVRLPDLAGGVGEDAVFVYRRSPGGAGGEADVLLLSPGESIDDLPGLRAYLGRCRERLRQRLKTPPR